MYLNPEAEHWLDWFHITMRLTVLGEQAKGVRSEKAQLAEEAERSTRCSTVQKLLKGVRELHTYISNNPDFHPELPRAVPPRTSDQHSLRGIGGKPGGEQTLCEETTDAVDATRRSSAAANADASLE